MSNINSAEYYINRAALNSEFRDINAVYYLAYYAAPVITLDELKNYIENKDWKTLAEKTVYNTQDDNYWVVGFRLQTGQHYIAIINEYFEVMYREKFVYTKLVPDDQFMSIPFKETLNLAYPLNPTSFFKRLYLRYFPHVAP